MQKSIVLAAIVLVALAAEARAQVSVGAALGGNRQVKAAATRRISDRPSAGPASRASA